MEYSIENEIHKSDYRPLYYVVYGRMVWPDNSYNQHYDWDITDFNDMESLLKWIIRNERDEDEFKIHYIRKMSVLSDSEIELLNSEYKVELEKYKEKKRLYLEIAKENAKKSAEAEAKRLEDNERKLYLRLKEKFENV